MRTSVGRSACTSPTASKTVRKKLDRTRGVAHHHARGHCVEFRRSVDFHAAASTWSRRLFLTERTPLYAVPQEALLLANLAEDLFTPPKVGDPQTFTQT